MFDKVKKLFNSKRKGKKKRSDGEAATQMDYGDQTTTCMTEVADEGKPTDSVRKKSAESIKKKTRRTAPSKGGAQRKEGKKKRDDGATIVGGDAEDESTKKAEATPMLLKEKKLEPTGPQTDSLAKLHAQIMAMGPEEVRKEWEQLLTLPMTDLVEDQRKETALVPAVQCLEATRVRLEGTEKSQIGGVGMSRDKIFYHGSKSTFGEAGDYYLLQAPKDSPELFWRIIFQLQPAVVFLLTPYYDDGRAVCQPFFPQEVGFKHYNKMFVNTHRVDRDVAVMTYTIEILPEGCSNSLVTKFCHCIQWNSGQLPPTKLVHQFIQAAHLENENQYPSAYISQRGTGRPAVLVALLVLYNRLLKGTFTSVLDVAIEMRKQRLEALDSLDQYIYLYIALTSYLKQRTGDPKLKEAATKTKKWLSG